MADAQKVADTNLASSVGLISSLLEQLEKAFVEFKEHRITTSDLVPWKDIEGYYRSMESMMKKKLEEVEVKEKRYAEKESHNNMVLAEREAAVVAKEQDLLDRVQELKDAAVVAIGEARASYVPDVVEAANGGDTNENKVSSSLDDAKLDAQEGTTPHTTGENVEGVGIEVNPRPELLQLCEQMDYSEILKFLMENLNNPSALLKEASVAFGIVTEPARLVLDALEGFFPPNETTLEGENSDAALHGMRRSCLVLLEALSAFLSKAGTAVDILTLDTKQRARSIAYVWKPKLAGKSIDASNKYSLEAEVFLRLLATFRISSEFDEDELCKYVLALAHHQQATELCHSLDLTQKIPGLVETLMKIGRQIDAVHFIHAFQLTEAYPTVPILKLFLKELRRNSQGNGSAALQNDYNARELEAVRAVIGCVEEYKLEDEYPLDPLYKRVGQLDKSVKSDRKRTSDTGKQNQQQHKKPKFDSRSQGHRTRGHVTGRQGQHSFSQRATYTGIPESYPPVVPAAAIPAAAVPTAYSYPVSSQYPYTAQANDQRLYYYAQDGRTQRPYSAAAPTYATYAQQSRQPYM